jgi:hypothetical protein
LSNPYLLDVWIANDSGNSSEAPELFANGIRGNPYVAPFYKDFGDYWYRNYATPYAWFFYDFARNLPDPNKVEMIAPLDRIEANWSPTFRSSSSRADGAAAPGRLVMRPCLRSFSPRLSRSSWLSIRRA